jgi:hypothetical protein
MDVDCEEESGVSVAAVVQEDNARNNRTFPPRTRDDRRYIATILPSD